MKLQQFSEKYGEGKLMKDYLSLIKKNMNSNSVILDAGCGLGGRFAKSELNKKVKYKLLIGIDLVKEKNPYLDILYLFDRVETILVCQKSYIICVHC